MRQNFAGGAIYDEDMPGDETVRTGALRFTATGDVEVFDGGSWRPLASLMGDSGMREDPSAHGGTATSTPTPPGHRGRTQEVGESRRDAEEPLWDAEEPR